MKKLLFKIPTSTLIIVTVLLGLAPFVPEPHLWEKLKMLSDGSLSKPIDIFDLFMHSAPLILLISKLIFMALDNQQKIEK
ncbi:MAG: RND transporter [Gammaproteobacteria bacterium]|nr:RND transporter [Gammaproteobacteria bacterium]